MADHSSVATARVRSLPSAPGQDHFERVPPHNLDAEVSVLGSMLLSKDAIAEVSELIGPEDFYRGAHRTMFEAMRDLYDRGEPVDPVTLSDELEGRGSLEDVGGAVAVGELVSRVPTAANALYYARIVSEQAIRRRLIEAGTQITKVGYDAEVEADVAVDSAEALVFQVAQRGDRGEFTTMKTLLTESFELIERLHENDSALTGLGTGFTDFDNLTAGLQPQNLVIVAARPAMGKCLASSAQVLDPETGARARIGDLVARGRAGEPVRVLALGRDLRLVPAEVSHVHENGVRPVYRLRTRLGREVVATANHPFLTPDGWLSLEELQPGRPIATPRRLPHFGREALPYAEVAALADQVTVRSASTPATPTPEAVFRLPRGQLAWFLHRLMARGGSLHREGARTCVRFATEHEELARDVAHLLLRFGVVAALNDPAGASGWHVDISEPEAVRAFVRYVGMEGREDELARALWLAGDEVAEERVLVGAVAGTSGRTLGPNRAALREAGASGSLPGPEADPSSDVCWDEVVSVEPAGEEPVYDLTVPEHHSFVADDVIVHNSTLVTNMATHVAVELRQPVVLYSLEMSKMELVQRILSAEAKVDSQRLRTGRLQEQDWPRLSQAMGRLAEAPLFIDDTPGINMMEIRSKSRRLKQKHGLSLVIVDYLQLMQSPRRVESRVQEVAEFSRGLKILAKELDVPVVALSQLSRKPEDRTDRRPQLADLRESGSIEQDADVVAFIYRDEVYDKESAAKGEAELLVAKHRNGPIGTIRLSFLGHHSRFANLARGPAAPGGGPSAPPAGAPL